MSHDTVLPLELIKEVLLNLDDDDKSTHSTCSQISTWFRHDHQRRLFSSVDLTYFVVPSPRDRALTLGDVGQTCKAVKFLSAIVGRPQLATYVRRFSFSIGLPRDSTGQTPQSPTENTSFLDILPRLTQIQQFICATRPVVNYRYLAVSVQATIRGTLERSKKLTHVDLSGISDVSPAVFLGATGVKHLTLASRISSQDEPPSLAPTVILRPTSLTVVSDMPHLTAQLHGIVQLLQAKNSPLSLSEVKTLVIVSTAVRPVYISALLEFAPKKTLTKLRLLCPDDAMQPCNFLPGYDSFSYTALTTPPPVVNLNSFLGLTHLDLLVTILALSNFDDFRQREENIVITPLAWVSSVLQSLPDIGTNDGPHLRLRLLFTIDVSSPDNHISLVPWGVLLNTLKSKQYDLKEVHIHLIILRHCRRHSSPQTPHDTIAALKRHLSDYSMLGDWVKLQYEICDAQAYKHPIDWNI